MPKAYDKSAGAVSPGAILDRILAYMQTTPARDGLETIRRLQWLYAIARGLETTLRTEAGRKAVRAVSLRILDLLAGQRVDESTLQQAAE